MSAIKDVDRLIERYHQALGEFVKGDPEPVKELFSHKDDVTLANPLGPPALGGDEVAMTLEHAASTIRDGEIIGFEIVSKVVTPELAYVLEIERQEAKMGANEDLTPFALRVTMDLQARRGGVEGGAPSCRPDNDGPACRVGDTGVALPLERTPEDSVVAKFAEYLSSTIFILDTFFV